MDIYQVNELDDLNLLGIEKRESKKIRDKH